MRYDSALALIHVDDAARLFRVEGPSGVQLRLADLHQANTVARQLAREMGSGVVVTDWTRTNRNWFDAVQLEKRLMFIILTLIVAVAAFNLVSTLVMTGHRQARRHRHPAHARREPALGDGDLHGAGRFAGVIGTFGGSRSGLLVAVNIDVIVPAIERALHVSFLPASVYLISRMPSDPQTGDVVPIATISLVPPSSRRCTRAGARAGAACRRAQV